MSYENFQSRVNALIARVGGITADFSHEDGKHIAVCSDGTKIVGNAISTSVKVIWGSGHASHAII